MHSMAASGFLGADFDVDMAVEQAPMSPVAGTTDGGDSSPIAQASSKWRKPTYIVRKVRVLYNNLYLSIVQSDVESLLNHVAQEEKVELLRELEQLQMKLYELQQAESREAAAAEANRKQNLLQQELETSLMRDAVRMQQLSLVQVQSAVSSYVVGNYSRGRVYPLATAADCRERMLSLYRACRRRCRMK